MIQSESPLGANVKGRASARLDVFVQQKLLPAALKRIATRVIGFVRRSGLQVLELEAGRVVCRMPLKGNVNHFGTMYAGALFTLAEFPGGVLFLGTFDWKRYIPIVTELNLQFLRVADGPVYFEMQLAAEEIARIQAELDQAGKSAFDYAGELKLADGTVVARSQAKYLIRAKRS